MNTSLHRQQHLAAKYLQCRQYDLTAKFVAASGLRSLCESDPSEVSSETISVLGNLLQDCGLTRHTRAYFLYKEAAGCLRKLAIDRSPGSLARPALTALTEALSSGGPSQRAAAESLGSLPVSVQGPSLPNLVDPENVPVLPLDTLRTESGLQSSGPPRWMGRSLVFGAGRDRMLLVLKVARSGEALIREVAWLDHFLAHAGSFPVRFEIPKTVSIRASSVFLVPDLPAPIPHYPDACSPLYAAAFLAHPDYFTYPNNSGDHCPVDDADAAEALFRNAFLLGNLSGRGMVHEAPIPLFHNRVQRDRRDDRGRYQWQRGGRLDRWLESAAFPNVGATGIRDFEHFISFSGPSRSLYFHLGTHLLSLLLVAGSYFRNKDKTRVGLDGAGKPVDARDLFSPPVMRDLVTGIFHQYYLGFVGDPFAGALPFDLEVLLHRMIQEMGRDRYMEEVLRVADQERMSETRFRGVLERHGFNQAPISHVKRGSRDIVLHTGPHLGGFNQRISLPELIEAVAAMSALCIAGRFCKENADSMHSPFARIPAEHENTEKNGNSSMEPLFAFHG